MDFHLKKFLTKYVEILRSFQSQKKNALLLFLALLFSAIGEAFNIGLLVPIVTAITGKQAFPLIEYLPANLQNYFQGTRGFISLITIFFIVIVGKNILKLIAAYLGGKLAWDLRVYWTDNIIRSYLFTPYHQMINYRQGTLVNDALEETLRASKLITQFISFNSSLIMFATVYLILLYNSVQTTLISTGVVFIVVLLLSRVATKVSVETGYARMTYQQKLYSALTEIIAGLKEVKVFQLENKLTEKIDVILEKYEKITIKFKIASAAPAPIIETVFTSLLCFALIFGILTIGQDGLIEYLPIGTLFLVGGMRLFGYFSQLNSEMMSIINLSSSMTKVLELSNSGISEKILKSSQQVEGAQPKLTLNKSIRLQDVSFRYPSQNALAVSKLNLSIEAKKSTFIIGKSGKGKSTIAYILLGLAEPEAGKIIVDDLELSPNDYSSWSNNVSYISQDNFLFHATIRENILMGSQNGISAEDFLNICNVAGVSDFVDSFPEKYETSVGERGAKLSEGQKQRVAMARAVAKNAALYIFDEPTSNLDKDTSKNLRQTIEYLLKKERTVVTISHKPEDLILADAVIEL